MRYCLAPHCPSMVDGRAAYCPSHAPKKAAYLGNRNRKSSGWEWSRIRRRVLSRAGFSCEMEGCRAPATEVDHIIPRSRGGSDEMDNLRALCPPHHREKSEAERLDGLRRR